MSTIMAATTTIVAIVWHLAEIKHSDIDMNIHNKILQTILF